MYDVGCTTEALGSAYVRRTMYDVRLQSLRALRGTVADGACLCTMYNTHDGPKQLRGSCSCTMYDLNASARCAGKAERERGDVNEIPLFRRTVNWEQVRGDKRDQSFPIRAQISSAVYLWSIGSGNNARDK